MSMPLCRLAAGLGTVMLAAGSLGCREAVRPPDVAGVFILDRIGSDTLPAVYYSDETFRVRVLADTLRLFEDGSGLRTGLLDYEVLSGGDGTKQEVPVANDFTFRKVNGRVEIAFACADTASCVAPPHFIARLNEAGLRVDFALGGRVPLIYREVGD